MQDIRFRTGAAIILSVAAFISLTGAVAVFLWWLVFTPRFSAIKHTRGLLVIAGMIAFFSLVLALSGGDGLSYFIRMLVIVLVGLWLYTVQTSGEFLRFGVWLLGKRIGFDLGLLAGMTLQSMDLLIEDFNRIRLAEQLKGSHGVAARIIPCGFVLMHGALSRAESTAELLAVRGYCGGGSCCPRFVTGWADRAGLVLALVVLAAAFLPVSAFFILYR
jgi:hypothetical protein